MLLSLVKGSYPVQLAYAMSLWTMAKSRLTA